MSFGPDIARPLISLFPKLFVWDVSIHRYPFIGDCHLYAYVYIKEKQITSIYKQTSM
jgi:hypothetical protein